MYVLKNKTLRANAHVFIHEYVHHLQIRGKNDNIRYNNLTRRKGYNDNDYEREANAISDQFIDKCCDYLNI
jgi:Zn-dependent peptidase ImmA (M78 family)